jgi:hypothetical protein
MRMTEHVTLAVSGLVFAGGMVLVGGTANAATLTSHENAAAQGATYSELSLTNTDRSLTGPPRCRKHMPGRMVVRHRGGKTVRVRMPGYWLPRGCRHS